MYRCQLEIDFFPEDRLKCILVKGTVGVALRNCSRLLINMFLILGLLTPLPTAFYAFRSYGKGGGGAGGGGGFLAYTAD